mgnify:CR=1 FL=1
MEYDDVFAEWKISFKARQTFSRSRRNLRLIPASILNIGSAVKTLTTLWYNTFIPPSPRVYRKSTAFTLWNCYRIKLAVAVTWNGDNRLSIFGLDFPRITAIPGITDIVFRCRMLLIAQMGIHFNLKHFFQYLGMQLFQKLAHISFCLELAKELLA